MDAPELGSLLIGAGLISEAQLQRAIKFQNEVAGGRLPVVLAKLGIVDEQKLVGFFSQNQGLPVADLDELILPDALIKKLPEELIRSHQILPISYKDDVLTIVTFDPYDIEALQAVEMAVECNVRINLARRSQIVKRIEEFFKGDGRSEPRPSARGAPEGEAEDLKSLEPALLPLLLEKRIVTREELAKKAKELGLRK